MEADAGEARQVKRTPETIYPVVDLDIGCKNAGSHFVDANIPNLSPMFGHTNTSSDQDAKTH
jgi:hypothetical protein